MIGGEKIVNESVSAVMILRDWNIFLYSVLENFGAYQKSILRLSIPNPIQFWFNHNDLE